MHRLPALHLPLSALLLAGCFLVPTEPTECSDLRPCQPGLLCDRATSTCREGPSEQMVHECQGDCTPCTAHADCPSKVCDAYRRTSAGGTCVPVGEVVYVDNRDGLCQAGMGGNGDTPESAMCTLTEGLARAATTSRRAIRVMPSARDYGPAVLSGHGISLFGPAGEGGWAQFVGAPGTNAVTIAAGSQIVLDGFDITRGQVGVYCKGREQDTRVALRRSRVTASMGGGLYARDCEMEVDRVLLAHNGGGALSVWGGRGFQISNSVIVKNRGEILATVVLATSAEGSFRFNTIVDNETEQWGTIYCGERRDRHRISDTILVRNQRRGGSQLWGDCEVESTVVGTTDSAPGIRQNPRFTRVADLDYALSAADPANALCCIDRARGAVERDYLGARRPQGARADIGAHEAQ